MNRTMSCTILLGAMALMSFALVQLSGHPDRETLLAVAAIVLILFALLLERFWPHSQQGTAVPRAELAGDVGSFVLIFGILDGALKWLTPFLMIALLPTLEPNALALWQQIILVTLWIEFAAWASHYAHHHVKPLWALHAMHHSTKQLYTLNNFRFHPFNHVLNHFAMILPPVMLGISAEAILVYTALSLPILLLQHSDVAFDFGRLNLVLNTNDLHRWHHSAQPDEGTKNLGRALVVWDQVFGTYLRHDPSESPAHIGLFNVSQRFPAATRYWAQLTWPFTKACCA